MHDILHISPHKMTFVPDRNWSGTKVIVCADVRAITSYKIRAHPCKSSDVITLKYTDILGEF